MKRKIWGLLVALLTLFSWTDVLFAQEEQVQLTVAPAFTLLNPNKLDQFNAIVDASGFKPFDQKVFPGFVVNTLVKNPERDLFFSTNTQVAAAVTETEERTLGFAAVAITFSLEKLQQITPKLATRYGGALGYGISTLSAQFEKDGSLEDQLSRAKYSQGLEFYLLAGPEIALDYAITDKIALTTQAHYLLPLGSWGTKDFSLPLGGPSIIVGVSFTVP